MRRFPLFLLFLNACWTPRTTGPRTMTGTVFDAHGEPIAQLDIDSVEAHTRTDADGHFGISYKAPDQSLRFHHQDLTWRRRYLGAEDDGKDVQIHLPPLAHTLITCERTEPCEGRLRWSLPEGLTADLAWTCDFSHGVSLPVPEGLPVEASCRDPQSSAPIPLEVHAVGPSLVVRGEPVPFTVALSTSERPLPQICTVRLDGVALEPGTNGQYVGRASGRVQLDANCDHVFSTPLMKLFDTPPEKPLELSWKHATLRLFGSEAHPLPSQLTLRMLSGRGAGWSLPLTAVDGAFLLPDLEPGNYVFIFGRVTEPFAPADYGTASRPGVLQKLPPRPGDGPEVERAVLQLERRMSEGELVFEAP